MNWMQIVNNVGPTGVWGIVALVLGFYAINKFSAPISKKVEGLKKIGTAEFESIPEQQTKNILPPTNTTFIEQYHPDSLIGRFQAATTSAMEKFAPEERNLHLFRYATLWQIWWHFENSYNHIFGSQMSFLQILNSQQMTKTQALLYYNIGTIQFPDFFQTYSFDRWINWLATDRKFIIVDGENILINEDGREFLKYVVGRGYTMVRPA